MYQNLRSAGTISYANVEKRYEAHQSKWPEAVWIEDSWFKYIDPLISPDPGKEPSALYLPMMQGSKEEQRKWWLYNRFQYMDSKWNAGDALSQVIQLRAYSKASITVTPYADIYPTIKYASYIVQARGQHGTPTTLPCPVDSLNDTEIYIYSAPQIADIGDLSPLTVGLVDVSKATKLQRLKVGSAVSGYSNTRMSELTLGTNRLLTSVDVRNCAGLGLQKQKTVDLSGCTAIREALFEGTNVTGVILPNGGVLETLHLPGTITNLTIQNQTHLSDFICPDYSHITTLWLDNPSSAIDAETIVMAMAAGSRVRLFGFTWDVESLSDVSALFDQLDLMRGIDQGGNNTEVAQLYGTIHVSGTVALHDVESIQARYPDVTITYAHYTTVLTLMDFEGENVISTQTITDGGSGTPVDPPAHANTAAYQFTGAVGWALTPYSSEAYTNAFRNVTRDRTIYAAYTYTAVTYTATFDRGSADGGGTLVTLAGVPAGTTPEYRGATPTSTREGYEFDHWSPALGPISANTTYTAVFKDTRSVLIQYLEGTLTAYESTSTEPLPAKAFYGANSLTSIKTATTAIGENAFYNCFALKRLEFTGNVATIGASLFSQGSAADPAIFIFRGTTIPTMPTSYSQIAILCSGNALFYVPDNLLDTWKESTGWPNMADYIYPLSDLNE